MDDVGEVGHLDLYVLLSSGGDGVGEDELDDFVANGVVGIVAEELLRLLVFVADDVHEVDLGNGVCQQLVEHHLLVNRQGGAFCGEGVGTNSSTVTADTIRRYAYQARTSAL